MEIDYDSLITFLIMWGTPTIMVISAYIRMDSEDRASAKQDLTSPQSIFTVGFLLIGHFVTSVGNLFGIHFIKYMGIVILVVGGVTCTLDVWKKSKVKGALVPVLISVAIYFLIV
ncbi:hypothetical protein ACFSUP_03695 [Gracilibacillus thailandensis]|uniref:Uncharacterized protein n=1 Tax=Gracilibacillus thailandensis TaxID=563735 RepID=A0A6N7QZ24_9BACI|nr:hypothetical protein [Gracilibacillus thailandensis]